MELKSLDRVDAVPMNMPGASGVQMRLMIGRDDAAPNFAMRVFDVAPGGHTPLHQHNYEHEILVLEGEGSVVEPDGQTERPIRAGDAILIPANDLHQFRNASDQVLRFLCMVPVQFRCDEGPMQCTPGS